MKMQKRDAYGNPITTERREFQSDVAEAALGDGLPGFKVGAYRTDTTKTTALLRRRPETPAPVAQWERHFFDSQVLERGIKRAINPVESPDLPFGSRIRIAKASWTNSPDWLEPEDCVALVELSLHGKRQARS
jgi:hypothetical protein